MRFVHSFCVQAPIEQVVQFHFCPQNLVLLTPSLARLRLLQISERLEEDAQIHFVFWLGFLPLRWVAKITHLDATSFTDEQLVGPFRFWRHHHSFEPISPQQTRITDEIDAALSWHPFKAFLGLLIWVGLPILFAYRRKQTQRLLETTPQEEQRPCA